MWFSLFFNTTQNGICAYFEFVNLQNYLPSTLTFKLSVISNLTYNNLGYTLKVDNFKFVPLHFAKLSLVTYLA